MPRMLGAWRLGHGYHTRTGHGVGCWALRYLDLALNGGTLESLVGNKNKKIIIIII